MILDLDRVDQLHEDNVPREDCARVGVRSRPLETSLRATRERQRRFVQVMPLVDGAVENGVVVQLAVPCVVPPAAVFDVEDRDRVTDEKLSENPLEWPMLKQ